VALLLTAAAWLIARPALAQTATQTTTPGAFLNVTFGVQPQTREFSATATPQLFQESGEFAADYSIDSGVFFDLTGGMRVNDRFTASIGVSFFDSNGTASGTATIPDPLIFNSFHTVPIQGDDLKRQELFINLAAVRFFQLSPKFDIAVSAGPSLVHAGQDFLSGQENGEAVAIVSDYQAGFGFGLNVGADAALMLSRSIGVGGLVRYTWGHVSLDAGGITVGGFQVGGGIRARF